MTVGRVPTEVDAIAEEWLDTAVEHAPEIAVELGRPGFEGRFSDHSPAGQAAFADARRGALRRLRAATPVDEVDAITVADLGREIELDLERHESGVPLANVAVIESPVQNIRDVFDLEPTATPEQWAVIAERMANVPAAVDGYFQSLREGARRGIVPARRQVRLAAAEAASVGADDGFFVAFAAQGVAREDVPDSTRRALRGGAERAAGAYRALAAFLEEDLAAHARSEDAVGRERYEMESRRFLGARVDLDETYEWGLEELARMVAEQEAIAREIVPGAAGEHVVEQAIAALDEDPAQTIEGTGALRDWMQEKSDAAVAALGERLFEIPEPVRRLDCRIAPSHSGVIYYTPPSDDFSRPGAMWWSVPEGVERFSTWRETTTVYHEGVPGHHLQNGIAIANRSRLNAWRRMTYVSGHGEGWALYAERLMADLGFLGTAAERFGMLDGQRMRAARVVLDIGVHLGKRRPDGEGTWDADFALAFMRRHMHMDDAFVRFEVNRYLGWPGQAPSYKIGQRVWEGVRDELRARQRAAFDLRAFHREALALGGVGLDTLRSALLG